MSTTIHHGDALAQLRKLPGGSVDVCVTSPPYYGLRNYQTDGQIGLEGTFREYIERLTAVFAAVHRVLKPTGVLWLNMGDSYVNDGGSAEQGETGDRANRRHTQARLVPQLRDLGLRPKNLIGQPWRLAFALQDAGWILRQENIWEKPTAMPESAKDRPTRSHEQVFLFSKSDEYFYDSFAVLEATTGNAHGRGDGVNTKARGRVAAEKIRQNESFSAAVNGVVGLRNLRSVWRIASQPFADEWCTACRTLYRAAEKRRLERDEKDRLICVCGRADAWVAHFACFPRSLVERCVLAGSSEHGCCGWCGAPYERIVERPKVGDWHPDQALKKQGVARTSRKYRDNVVTFSPDAKRRLHKAAGLADLTRHYREGGLLPEGRHDVTLPAPRHVGWRKGCRCEFGDVVPATVLDPFAGAATTLMVAERLGRDAIGIELNADYVAMAEARLARERAKWAAEREKEGVGA